MKLRGVQASKKQTLQALFTTSPARKQRSPRTLGTEGTSCIGLDEHHRGKTVTTAKDAPWTLVAQAQFNTLQEARQCERTFKQWKNPARVQRWFQARNLPFITPG